jgi:hypothetical protein
MAGTRGIKSWRWPVRFVRNAAFVLLILVLLTFGGRTKTSAYGYCGWYGGVDPAWYGGFDTPHACSYAEDLCEGIWEGDLCESYCNLYCGTSNWLQPVSCDIDYTPGGGQCMLDAECICDLDVGR